MNDKSKPTLKTFFINSFYSLKNLWKNDSKVAQAELSRDMCDFLPPSLEVVKTPPHPTPRLLMWITITIFFLGILWASLSKVDIITVAEGKIIPGGRIRIIKSLDRAFIKNIWVTEGQYIKADQPLVELDQTQTTADEKRITSDLSFTTNRLSRRKLLASFLREGSDLEYSIVENEINRLLINNAEEARLLFEEWKSIASDIDVLKSQLIERETELNTANILVKQYTETLPLVESRVSAIKPLYEQNIVSKLDYLDVEEERIKQSHSLEAEKSRAIQLTAAIKSMEQQIASRKAKNLAEVLIEIKDLERQEENLKQELTKVKDIVTKQILTSPVEGTVKGLAIYTVGGVVDAAEPLMEIVPIGETLEVEAFVNNQDIGYITENQAAEVKINTFPFTKYGIIPATVSSVARDATIDEKQGLIYRIILKLHKNSLLVDGKDTKLLPGMAVSAEISTGKRRLIEYFLAPLLRVNHESLKER